MRMQPTRIAIGLAIVAMLFGLTACSGQGDLHEWVAQVKARKGAPLPPLPVVKTFETFLYQDQDKRDPFEPAPPQASQGMAGPHPDQDRPREPLEAFPLDSLKMVGTIGATNGRIEALIKDPQGVVHQVHVGDYMGQNYGHVTAVTQSEVNLVELVPSGSGGWMERDASVAMGDK